MTDLGLPEALRLRADRAAQPPADLADLVEGRFRVRRRRRRAATAALAAAGVLATAVVALTGGHRAPATPATPPTPTPLTIVLPSGGPDYPVIDQVWPRLIVDLPAKAPDGGTPEARTNIDEAHVLVTTNKRAVYSYDVDQRTFQLLIPDHQADHGLQVTPRFLYWRTFIQPGRGGEMHRMPITGGKIERLTADLSGSRFQWWYATDDAVYGSTRQSDRLWRFDVPTGRTTVIEGLGIAGVYLHSPWIAQDVAGRSYPLNLMVADGPILPTALRDIETGERRDIVRSEGVKEMGCSPQVCVTVESDSATNAPRYYVQRLDGSQRSPLPVPYDGPRFSVIAVDRGPMGVFLLGSHLYDPATGKVGSTRPPRWEGCGGGMSPNRLKLYRKTDGKCVERIVLLDRLG